MARDDWADLERTVKALEAAAAREVLKLEYAQKGPGAAGAVGADLIAARARREAYSQVIELIAAVHSFAAPRAPR